MTKYLLICATVILMGACASDNHYTTTPVYDQCPECGTPVDDCNGAVLTVRGVAYSMTDTNDLVLETDSHIIQINALPGNMDAAYYVWVGDEKSDSEPDLIIEPE